ncbi:hypothetical protein GJ496_010474 [Pomphorhynchus laevis]|nr:hypothetical protein GJ496_010474 [Pomphorhynchus laevis]
MIYQRSKHTESLEQLKLLKCEHLYFGHPTDHLSSVFSVKMIFRHSWRHPDYVKQNSRIIASEYKIEENVWLKSVNARCTSKWTKEIVTDVLSESCLEIDGYVGMLMM